ncbi:UDP-glucose 4-epimerase [Ascobolus immersus RN42]|uniref:UDP-glucose 4-epimerase n=1 Tax=Ascobolus immersus RN42 TaxID=1160509 RepID=A0A3N4IR79_ASCIM|nr:UDP-glucose 4-epimerase [Ascobolus immersus RN42]
MASQGTILVTGGCGYIGSFTTLELILAGYDVIIVDNLTNSSEESLNRIELLSGKKPKFYNVDVTDGPALNNVFSNHPEITGVIHFAALKAVGESVEKPLEYYRVNVGGSITLLQAMENHDVKTIVFSSSATVYGDATKHNLIPIPETCPLGPTNPYGNTKLAIELVIRDQCVARKGMTGALLRYFNPAGAHPSGIMGEDPQGVPYNLLPLLAQVATGKREKLQVFGTDYDSHDGTAIRDYIHVIDLAKGHIAALKYLKDHPDTGCREWNLGTGKGSTVFDMIKAFSKSVGRDLPYEIKPRRAGDVLDLTAKPNKANEELGWKAEKTLESACDDLWKWASNNPQGYRQQPPQELLAMLDKYTM